MTVRVVVAHPCTMVRDLLRLLTAGRGIVVVGEARRADELAELCAAERPDVVVTEADFDDGSAVETVLAAVLAGGARAVVISDDPSPERVTALLDLGASGFLRHDAGPVDVVDAIEAVAAGAAALEASAAATVLEQWRRLREPVRSGAAPAGLTAREHEVLAAMAEGLPAKAIARRLGIAVKTVENHKIRVFEKLGVHTQAHAVALAVGHGLLSSPSPSPATGRGGNPDAGDGRVLDLR